MSGTSKRRLAATIGGWLLVFVSVVTWRQGVLYSGGVDPVVVGKAAAAVAALAAALLLRRTSSTSRTVNIWPPALVLTIVAASLIGANVEGELLPNLVLAVRIVLLAATIVLLVTSMPTEVLLSSMLAAMSAVALFAVVTAIPAFVSSRPARLSGGIPQLAPNELATLLLPPAIGLSFVIVRNGVRLVPMLGLAVLVAPLLATGSRAALLMLVVALLVQVLVARRLTAGTIALLLVGALAAYSVLAFSSALEQVALRGQGTGRLLTLNSRTISWQVVLGTPPTTWEWWLGRGLSVKSVPVVGQFWTRQVFDSSWISSLAQSGVVGTALLAVYVIGTVVRIGRTGCTRALTAALAVTILIRSFVENGLIESSATFAIFFAIALVCWPTVDAGTIRRRDRGTGDRSVTYPLSLTRQVGSIR